jgi:hypothetical protein
MAPPQAGAEEHGGEEDERKEGQQQQQQPNMLRAWSGGPGEEVINEAASAILGPKVQRQYSDQKQFSEQERQDQAAAELLPPAKLILLRIRIEGRGTGTVLGMTKKRGGSTLHTVLFDRDHNMAEILLRRKNNGGELFVILTHGKEQAALKAKDDANSAAKRKQFTLARHKSAEQRKREQGLRRQLHPVDDPAYVLDNYGSSFFKLQYDLVAKCPDYVETLLAAVRAIVQQWCEDNNMPEDHQHNFLDRLRKEWGPIRNTTADVAIAAQRVWTSQHKHSKPSDAEVAYAAATDVVAYGSGTEFCSMLGAAMRADRATLAKACARVAHALSANNELVTFPRGPHVIPREGRSSHEATCWRGGGFRDTPANRSFFQSRADMAAGDPAKKYRVAQFLPTSFDVGVANRFITRASGGVAAPGALVNALVRWRVNLDPDPQRRCRHVNLVTETHVKGELEYLFGAFSVFSVVAVHWSGTPQESATPHEITIHAAHDNLQEDDDLPLAPWA